LLDDVQPFVELAAQRLAVKILAQKDSLDDFTEFGECPVGGVLDVIAGEPTQDRFRLRRAKPQRLSCT